MGRETEVGSLGLAGRGQKEEEGLHAGKGVKTRPGTEDGQHDRGPGGLQVWVQEAAKAEDRF